MNAVPQPASARPTYSAFYRAWLLFVLLLVGLINYADRTVVNSVIEPIRHELHLTDTQIGWLQGLSFGLLYAVLGIPFARLAERHSRVRIIAAATFAWSVMTALCGSAAGYAQLLTVRLGVGVGEAGFMAPASSLIGDHFRPDQRVLATSIMMLGVPFGALIGATSGGLIAQTLGWRWAFVIMAAPGLVIALLVFLTLGEPQRGMSEAVQEQDVPPLRDVASRCLSNPTFRHVLMGSILGGFGLHGLGQFLNVYLVRVHHLPLREAGALYGIQSFVSISVGLMAGGWLANYLGRRNPRFYTLIPAAGMFLSVPIYLAAFHSAQQSLSVSLPLIILAGSCLLLHYGPSLAIVQNLSTPLTRASTVAVYMLFTNLIAQNFGAPLIGFMSDHYAAAFGAGLPEEAARALGVRYALMTSTVLYAWGGVHYLLAQRQRLAELTPATAAGPVPGG